MVGVFNSLEQSWIFENFQGEEIDISNDELEINKNFKKYNGKKVVFHNCPNLKRIKTDCLNLTGLEIENCSN